MDPETTAGQPASDASERVDVLSSTETSAYTLTVAEAATLMARSEGTVRRLIRTGELPAAMVQGGAHGGVPPAPS